MKNAKDSLNIGIVKWTEYQDQYKEALNWLTKTEALVQSYNKLQDSLEDKKNVLEQFQVQLQVLFDWQKELDRLNMLAQILLETCADARVSNAVTQLTTKYNALLSLAKEIMRRLELHYQEHSMHHQMYEECQYYIEKTREKLSDCQAVPSSMSEVQIKLNTVKSLRQGFEQGQNKLRYVLELKEKVILNSEANGAAKIQEDTESLKEDFEKLLIDLNDVRAKLTARAADLEEIHKLHKLLSDWLDDIEPNIIGNDELYNDLSDKRAALEKFRGLQRDMLGHNEIVEKIQNRLNEPAANLNRADFNDVLQRFEKAQDLIGKNIDILENQVNNHEKYKQAFAEIYDWIRKVRLDIQQCCDAHGNNEGIVKKLEKLQEIDLAMPEGKILMETAIELSHNVAALSGSEGQDTINQEIKQLKSDWDNLQTMSAEAHGNLKQCIASWNNFNGKFDTLNKWVQTTSNRVTAESEGDKKTAEDLARCKVNIIFLFVCFLKINFHLFLLENM